MQLVRPAVDVAVDEHRVLRGVVGQRPGAGVAAGAGAGAANRDERVIPPRLVIVRPQVPILHVKQRPLVRRVRRALALELEHDHPAVVPRREEVHLRVRAENPKPVVLSSKRLHPRPLAHVPHSDGLILRVRDDDVLPRVKHHARHVVHVPAQGVHLPRLGIVHPPQLHLTVIRARDDERQRRVETRPVHAAVVALEDVLHDRVAAAEELVVHRLRETHEIVPGRDGLFTEPADIPYACGLIQRRRHHQIFLRVKHRAHDVVVVPGEDADAVARLPVPDPDRLIVRRGDDPRVLGVERDGADVVEVAQQREEAAAEFVVPHLDLVVVA